MNIKEIFDNMTDFEKSEMCKLFEAEKKQGQIKKDFRNIIRKIKKLNSDDPATIRRLAMKFKKWCEWNKYFDFSYNVIAPQGYSVYVLFRMDYGEFMMKAYEFCEFIAEQLESFADTDEYTKDVVYEWKKETEELTKLGEL